MIKNHSPVITYFFLSFILTVWLTASPATALQPGRLIILLHETGSAGTENQSKKEIGAVTMRAAIAIAQEAGIIITSPAIWANLLARCAIFNTAAEKPGSLPNLFKKAWDIQSKRPSAALYAQIQAMLNTDRTLLHHLYISMNQPAPENWVCYQHPQTNVIILVPRAYIDQRLALLPRNIPVDRPPLDYATGLTLSKCTPISLPPVHQSSGPLARLISQAHHLIKRSTFTLHEFTNIFIPTTTTHHLLCVPWNIYMIGHGTYQQLKTPWGHLNTKRFEQTINNKKMVCGIPAATFDQWLQFCNTNLTVHCFYYQSCYGSGVSRTILNTPHQLHFPLIAGAVGEAPVHILMPRSSGSSITVDTNIALFFEALERDELSWPAILSPITPLISLPGDLHSISSTPLLIPANHTEPIPIDVNQNKETSSPILNKNKIRAGISLFSAKHESQFSPSNKPFIVRGQRALLISPTNIATPLELHPYQKIIHTGTTATTTFIAPAILSIHPGNAIHHCAALTAHTINLKDFLSQSFLQLTKQQSTKVFLFDSLTLDNDLDTNFTNEASSWWNRLTGTIAGWISPASSLSTPRITLQKVVIIVGCQRLTCIFLEPCMEGTLTAHKIIYYRPSGTGNATPERLSKEQILVSKHTALYNKYSELCTKQR